MSFGFGFGMAKAAAFLSGPVPSLNLQFAGNTVLDPRITFTRASSATYFNSAGVLQRATYNLLTYSEQFDNAAWIKSQASITANTAIAPDGASTADKIVENTATNPHYVDQATTTTAANHAFSVYLKAGERTAALLYHVQSNVARVFDLSLGALGGVAGLGTPVDSSIVSVGNGWYRCTIVATATAASNQFRVYTMQNLTTYNYTGNGTSGIFIWGAQLEQASTAGPYYATTTAANGAPRFDYNPTTLAPLGLLIEEQRTNLLTYSEQFDGGIGWGASNLTVTANALVSPGGTITADQLVPSTGGSVLRLVSQTVSSLSASTTYTLSVFAKIQNIVGSPPGIALRLRNSGGTSDAYSTFTLSTGTTSGTVAASGVDFTGGTATIANVGNGWYRCTMTATVVNALTSPRAEVWYGGYQGTTNVGDIFIWGAQLEQGSFATSYIPTVAAQVTRSADSASMTGTNFSSWYNATEGTLYAEGSIPFVGGPNFPGLFTVDDGTVNNSATLYVSDGGADYPSFAGYSGGVTQWDIARPVAYTPNTVLKMAGAYKANDFSAAFSGVLGTPDTSGTVPTVTTARIGAVRGGNSPLNGWIRKVAFYPTRLANATLQALTT